MKTDEPQENAFLHMLQKLRKGEVLAECAEKTGALIAAVKHTGSKGKLVLEIAVLPDDKGEVRTVDVVAEVRLKAPERKKRATTFFVVGEQSLSTAGTVEDQPEFNFEAAPVAVLDGRNLRQAAQ